jgi:hypothetical protein
MGEKKPIIAAVIALLIIVIVAGSVYFLLPRPSTSKVTLADGKKITVGGNTEKLKQDLQNNVKIDAKADTAIFPADSKTTDTIQAFFSLKNNEVTRAVYYLPRFDGDTLPGQPLLVSELKKQYGSKLTVVNKSKGLAKFEGFMLSDPVSNTYYLVDPCSDKSRIVTVLVTLKAYNDTSTSNFGIGCNVSGH